MLSVRNLGTGAGTLKLALTGGGAPAFSVDAGLLPQSLAPGAGTQLEVRFSPTDAGTYPATLEISDALRPVPAIQVVLTGVTQSLPLLPTLRVSTATMAGAYVDCLLGLVCAQDFADTMFKEAAAVEIKLTNTGCPALKITGLELINAGTGNLAYFIDAPSILPTAATPLVLTPSEDRQTTKLKVRFAPEEDGSGSPTRFATLRIKTNDPNARDGDNNVGGFDVLLSGNALAPSLYSTPTGCDFSDPADLCGNAAKIAGKANFLVRNQGNLAIKIDSTVFKSNSSETAGKDGRLAITGAVLKGAVIAPGASAPIEITHTDMPLYIQDLLTISASVSPSGAPGSAGRAVLSLAGGKKPCLTTSPAIDPLTGQARIDFGDPATVLSTKTLTIKNGPATTCGDLIINSLVIDPSAYFSLVAPAIAPGSKVLPGGSLDATVQYQKAVSGGVQVGTLRIDSNDGAFSSPPGYLVQLYSQAPLDQVPVAVLKGCLPSDITCATGSTGTMAVSLAALPAGPAGTRLLTMFGSNSYDPPGTTTKATNFRFRLASKPANASGAALENDGQKAIKSAVTLSLDGVAVGSYRVMLDVWDALNQQSAVSAELKLNVSQ